MQTRVKITGAVTERMAGRYLTEWQRGSCKTVMFLQWGKLLFLTGCPLMGDPDPSESEEKLNRLEAAQKALWFMVQPPLVAQVALDLLFLRKLHSRELRENPVKGRTMWTR